jgi:hypothetical protein
VADYGYIVGFKYEHGYCGFREEKLNLSILGCDVFKLEICMSIDVSLRLSILFCHDCSRNCSS